MDEKSKDNGATASDRQEVEEPTITSEDIKPTSLKKTKASKCVKVKHKKKSKSRTAKRKSHAKGKKPSVEDSSSDSSSSDDDSDSEDNESDDSSSEEELMRKKKSKSKQAKKLKEKERKRRRNKKHESSSESEESESEESEADSEEDSPRKKKLKKKAKVSELESEEPGSASDGGKDVDQQIIDLMTRIAELKSTSKLRSPKSKRTKKASKPKSSKKTSDAMAYKRVDQLWDSSIHNYKLKESAEGEESEFGEFAFLVRRKFDWEGKYDRTVVDIKSKLLRAVLAEVMKECKSVSLETEEPCIDPNILFLYLEDLRKYYKKTLKKKIASEKKKKNIKKLSQKRSLTKALCKYIDEDYADTKKELYPLLESGNITFELLWALFTPNDIAITSCYGAWDEPRCFKVEYAMKYSSMTRGEWYCVEGKYMEYDGKAWGFGEFEIDIEGFKGPRKITSLTGYPIKYHSSPDGIKKQIIERGQRFVAMEPQEYKFHRGLAFMKKKKQVLKININGRVMIDPATFRRVNPNYPISLIKPDDGDDLFSAGNSDDDGCSCCDSCNSDDEDATGGGHETLDFTDAGESKSPKYKYKLIEDGSRYVAVEVDEDGDLVRSQQLDKLQLFDRKRSYTEEELLLTSPVVLGFAFSEKLWLEFSISGVVDITYNDQAFSSLVLPGDQKSTVHALVKSHKFNAAKTIDDVVQGKGRGLVFVLHGPPGTGKTLTAEGISELLRCPLYCVSAGELGTDPARLETELQKVLDIAHSWGALLLLDEADVFLEKRQVTDLHRNALVSIFLRLLEYFQGILFLTTNRVETFDDAFQSRIHVALRYDELTPIAKKEVWKNFIQMVRKQDGGQVADFSEGDFTTLSRHRLNGRQIKNTVRTAQALALNENEKLTMNHIKRVLDVAETFDRDLKGGAGYVDAMRSYT